MERLMDLLLFQSLVRKKRGVKKGGKKNLLIFFK